MFYMYLKIHSLSDTVVGILLVSLPCSFDEADGLETFWGFVLQQGTLMFSGVHLICVWEESYISLHLDHHQEGRWVPTAMVVLEELICDPQNFFDTVANWEKR